MTQVLKQLWLLYKDMYIHNVFIIYETDQTYASQGIIMIGVLF